MKNDGEKVEKQKITSKDLNRRDFRYVSVARSR